MSDSRRLPVNWIVETLAERDAIDIAEPEIGKFAFVRSGGGALYQAIAQGVGTGKWGSSRLFASHSRGVGNQRRGTLYGNGDKTGDWR